MRNESAKKLEISLCSVHEDHLIQLFQECDEYLLDLQDLSLTGLGLTDKSAHVLSVAMQQCPLKRVDLSANLIGSMGLKYLASGLLDSGLEILNLARNQIGNRGVEYLAKILVEMKLESSLSKVNLSSNQIEEDGWIALACCLYHTRIKHLELDENTLTPCALEELSKEICIQRRMEHLSLKGTGLTDASIPALIQMIQSCPLERLNLDANQFTDKGMADLVQAIETSRTLEELSLKGNMNLSNISGKLLYEATMTHYSLRSILLDDTRIEIKTRQSIQNRLKVIHTERSKVMIVLCGVYKIPRLFTKSSLTCIPMDLMRYLRDFI